MTGRLPRRRLRQGAVRLLQLRQVGEASVKVKERRATLRPMVERALMRALEAAGERVAMLRQTVAGARPLEPALSAGSGEGGGDSEATAAEPSGVSDSMRCL